MNRFIFVLIYVVFICVGRYYAQSTFTTAITVAAPTGCGNTTLTANALSDIWVQKANFGGGAHSRGVGFSISNKGYICSDFMLGTGPSIIPQKSFWEYDPASNIWTQKATFPGPTRQGAIGFSVGGKGYICAGLDQTTSFLLNDLWEYDPVTNNWLQKANLPLPIRNGIAFCLGNKGYVGIAKQNTYYPWYTNNFWEYNPLTDTWMQKATFPGAFREIAVGFSIGNKGYVGAGAEQFNVTWNDFWEYNPLTDAWTQKSNYPGAGAQCSVGFGIGNKGYIGTGSSGNVYHNDFYEFDPGTNNWTQKANFGGAPRYFASGFNINCNGYIGTGESTVFSLYDDFWEYHPSVSYAWSNGASTSSISIGLSGIYTVTVTNAGGCTATASVAINALPTPTITGIAYQTLCLPNTTATITVSGASTYTLLPGNINGSSFTVNPLSTTTYTVMGTSVSGCTSIPSTHLISTVNVVNTPTLSISSNLNPLCSGETSTLTVTGADNYTWSGTTNYMDTAIVSPIATTVFSVTGTSIYGCVSNPGLITVTVVALPVISVNSPTICAGINALLTATCIPSNGTSYVWMPANSTGNSINVNPTSDTNYTVTATNGSCSSSAVSSVIVNATTTAVTGFSYQSPVCNVSPDQFPNIASGFTSNGAFSSSSGLSLNNNSGSVNFNSSSPGSYIVTYSVAPNNCVLSGSSTASIVINPQAPANTNFLYDLPLCSLANPASPNLSSGFSGGGAFTGSPGLTIDASTGIIDLTNTLAGTYTVSYAVNALNCVQAGSQTVLITINQSPTLTVNADVTITQGSTVNLIATSSSSTYTWSPSNGLSCSNCSSPVASPIEATTYCVKTTDGTCINSTCVNVTIESPCSKNYEPALPNAFSPNGDSHNDRYCLQNWNECITDFSLSIYDRWGEKVFETADPLFCWDGTYRGQMLDTGVFVYYLKIQFNQVKTLKKSGNITLIR